MTLKKPIVLNKEAHSELKTDDKIDASVINIASKTDNIIKVDNNGLYVAKPTASDVGALPATGGNVSSLTVNNKKVLVEGDIPSNTPAAIIASTITIPTLESRIQRGEYTFNTNLRLYNPQNVDSITISLDSLTIANSKDTTSLEKSYINYPTGYLSNNKTLNTIKLKGNTTTSIDSTLAGFADVPCEIFLVDAKSSLRTDDTVVLKGTVKTTINSNIIDGKTYPAQTISSTFEFTLNLKSKYDLTLTSEFGIEQKYYDCRSETTDELFRKLKVTYVNSNNKPMEVKVILRPTEVSSTYHSVLVSMNETQLYFNFDGSLKYLHLSFIVPPNSEYSIQSTRSDCNIESWYESAPDNIYIYS